MSAYEIQDLWVYRDVRDVCYFVQVLAYFPAVNPCRVGRYTLESIDQQLCTAEVASSSIIPGSTGGGRI